MSPAPAPRTASTNNRATRGASNCSTQARPWRPARPAPRGIVEVEDPRRQRFRALRLHQGGVRRHFGDGRRARRHNRLAGRHGFQQHDAEAFLHAGQAEDVGAIVFGGQAAKAVCLLSGGLDSSTCLALARREGYACYALSFDYGQRHKIELEAASAWRPASAWNGTWWPHRPGRVRRLGAHRDIAVPKARSAAEMSHGIPVTYVPARNTIFLSFALAWAEVLESSDVFIGVNALDYSGYPDCRPEYIEAYERMANLATRAGVEGRTRLKIHTPLMRLTKAEIVKLGHELGLDFSLTFSCYDPGPEGRPCGQCDACLLRRKGFQEAGIEDR
jgi:7-cyano-7-deazaguanine synthase